MGTRRHRWACWPWTQHSVPRSIFYRWRRAVDVLCPWPVSTHQQSMILSLYPSFSGLEDDELFEISPQGLPKWKPCIQLKVIGIHHPKICHFAIRIELKAFTFLRSLISLKAEAPKRTHLSWEPSEPYPDSCHYKTLLFPRESPFIFPKSMLFHKNSFSPFLSPKLGA